MILRKIPPLFLLLFFATSLVYGKSQQPGQVQPFKRTLRVGWQNWSPFAFSPDGTSQNATGMDVEILRAVMEMSHLDFQFSQEEIPRKRQLLMLKNGELDLIFGAFKRSEIKNYGLYTDQYRSRSVGLFVRRGQSKRWKHISSIDDLPDAEISIGVVRGYSYGTQVNSLLERMSGSVYKTTNAEQTRLMLTHRHIDGYLAYLPDESITINENDLDYKIQLHPMRVIYSGGIHFLLSKKSAGRTFLKELNKGLQSIKENGRYDQIIKKYTLLYGIDNW